MAEGPLSDLRVVEYSHGVQGAMCARAMGDMGADVVKVEPPEGDPTRRRGPFPQDVPDIEASGQFLYLNANKRGVTLDLRSRDGYDRLTRLLRAADVFVTDLSPHRSGDLALDYPRLKELNPGLVVTHVTPFGMTGPYREYKGSDLIAFHMGGLGYDTPERAVYDLERDAPLRGGGYQADYLAGWTAAAATMTAVLYRERYGVGQMVDVSAMEAVANHIRANFASYSYDPSGLPASRLKSNWRWSWPCKDGHISTSFLLDHWWRALKELMGHPQWAENPEYDRASGRRKHMDALEELTSPWFRQHTRAELYRLLQGRRVSCFPVLSIEEVLDAPQYMSRGFFVEQDHPVAGKVVHPGPPVRMCGTAGRPYRPAPTLGQHNAEVLREISGKKGARPLRRSITDTQRDGERNRPLEGVRVLDFGWILSVPFCGAWLGTMGAEVIRIESQARLEEFRYEITNPADGIPGVNRSAFWNGINYSKLDVTLNLANKDAIELVRELVAVSDVVMENFSPGVMERLGLGYEELRKIRPDLIMASAYTLGATGPERDVTGWGPNVCAYAGLSSITGDPDGPPANVGGNWPDYLAGTVMIFSVLGALRHRRKTGRGQYIDLSIAETVCSAMPEAFLEFTMHRRQTQRVGNHDPHMAPHNVYSCQGHDQWIAIAVSTDEEWRAMCQAMGRPDLAQDPRFETLAGRKDNEEGLDTLVAEWARRHSPRDAMRILQKAGVPAGPVMSVFELMEDPHLTERGFVVEMDHPEVGRRTVAGLPARFSDMPRLAYSPAPLLGQHNEYLFGELLGLEAPRLQSLVSSEAIY